MARRVAGPGLWPVILASLAAGGSCARGPAPPRTDAAEPVPAAPLVPPAPSPSPGEPTRAAAPPEIQEDEALTPGEVAFAGIVRPVKGGLDVHGVTLDEDDVLRALSPAGARSAEALLGARAERLP